MTFLSWSDFYFIFKTDKSLVYLKWTINDMLCPV